MAEGTSLEKEIVTYRLPKTLLDDYSKHALMLDESKAPPQLIVLQRKPEASYSFDYVQVNEEPMPTLANILKQSNPNFRGNKLKDTLSGPIDCQEFVDFLFETNQIFDLDPYPLQFLLKIIQEKRVLVNLRQKHPETNETLLEKYSKNTDVLKILLKMDPGLIERTETAEITFLNCLLKGNKKGASVLSNAREDQKIELSSRGLLFAKVAFSEDNVSLDELSSLSKEDQDIVYRLANTYSKLDILRTMRSLGFGGIQEPLMFEGPSIFGCNMDALEMHESLEKFLKALREKNLLLKQSEFELLPEEDYIEKGYDIGRVLGRDYIERKAHELGLKRVKAPKKIAVIDDNIDLKFRTGKMLNLESSNIRVYAQKIERSDRDITQEEVEELLRLFEASGYTDIHWGNVIVAEDGVYVIDTEFTNFWVAEFYFQGGRQHLEMAKIVHALPKENQQKFIDEINTKIAAYRLCEDEIKERRALRRQTEEAALRKTGCLYGISFTFPPQLLG